MWIIYYDIGECYYILSRVCDSFVMWLMIEKWILNDKVVKERELIENDMQWIALYEMSVWEWFEWKIVWFEWIGMVRELLWSSL